MVKSNLARALSISAVVLFAGVGVAGCSSSDAPNSSDSSQSKEVKHEHTKAEVKEVLDAYFATLADETEIAVENLEKDGIDVNAMTEAQIEDMFNNEFPKSHEYISDEVDDETKMYLIASFSSIDIFTPGSLEIKAVEDKIELNDDSAHISGNDFILRIDGEEQPRTEESRAGAGAFDLKYIDGKWKFTAFDIGAANAA